MNETYNKIDKTDKNNTKLKFSKNINIPAVILAAGRGNRLRPYTDDVPKPLLKVVGKPILEYVLVNLFKSGIRHFILITGYKAEMIEDWIQNEFLVKIYKDYKKELGCDVGSIAFSFIRQKDINGTGGAALLAERHVIENKYEDFLLTYGDILVEGKIYQRLVDKYLQNSHSLYLVGNHTDDPSSGAAIYYNDDLIVDFIEKPEKSAPKTDLNNAGIYIFKKTIFEKLHNTGLSARGEIELTAPVIQMVKNGLPIGLVKMSDMEFWCDVGTTTVYEELNTQKDLADKLLTKYCSD